MTCNPMDFQILLPAGDYNHIANPSFEFDIDGYTAGAGTTLTRNTTERWSGAASVRVSGGVVTPIIYSQGNNLNVTPGAVYYMKIWFKGVAGETYQVIISSVPGTLPYDGSAYAVATGEWQSLTAAFIPTIAQPAYYISCATGSSGSPFYVDGIEVVTVSNATYLDGDQIDCAWTGIPHASPSYRRATMRGGGIPTPLTTWGLRLGSESGTGLRPISFQELDRPDIPGTQTTGMKVPRRVWQIGGIIKAETFAGLRTYRNELIDAIAPVTTPRINGAPQPVRWRIPAGEKTLQIDGHYEAGLDVGISADDLVSERVALRVLSNDNPLWYALPQDGAALDYQDAPTYTTAFAVGRIDGAYEVLQTTAGGTGTAYCVAVNGDGNVYFGGDFTSINGDATLQYCAYYNPLTGAWGSLATGAVTGIVRALLPLPDGRIMLGGQFTNVGDANGDYAVIYNPATDAFVSLNANPLNGNVYALALDPTTGDVILGGAFTADAVPTTLNYVARWTGGTANYSANGTTLDAQLWGVGVRRGGQIVVAGDHTEYISACDVGTTTWYEVGNVSGANNQARTVFVDPDDDTVFVGGTFTQFDGETANEIVQFGTISAAYVQWQTLGGGFTTNAVRGIAKNGDGSYRVVGTWSTVNDLEVNPKIVRWTGSVWSPELLNLVWASLTGCYGVAIGADGSEWYACSLLPAGSLWAGVTTITLPDGAAPTPPVISVRKDGSTGTARLYGVENLTRPTGRVIFDPPLILDDETIAIDCHKRVVLSSSGRQLAVIAGTYPSLLYWGTGANRVAFFVSTASGATVTARAHWETQYWSIDAWEDAD